MVKQSQPISGVGHQYRAKEKSFAACKQSIQQAMMDILDLKNEDQDAKALFLDLSKCFEKAILNESIHHERFNRNSL
jgi:hypothetical protein